MEQQETFAVHTVCFRGITSLELFCSTENAKGDLFGQNRAIGPSQHMDRARGVDWALQIDMGQPGRASIGWRDRLGRSSERRTDAVLSPEEQERPASLLNEGLSNQFK